MSKTIIAHASQPVDVIAKQSRTNFYYSFLSLPPAKRKAIETVYAFCRLMDDIADEDLPVSDASVELTRWRQEIKDCFGGQPLTSLGRAIQETIAQFPIPERYFQELITGMEMDLKKCKYETFAELEKYCYHVAGVTGLMCIEIFGYSNKQAEEYARNLGTALQLVNIIRDLKEDALRGRIYLPKEELQRFGYREEELLNFVYNDKFVNLMEFQAKRARQFFMQAKATLIAEDRRRMVAAQIMGSIYFRILEHIEAAKFRVFDQRISLSTPEKVWVAVKAWWQAR